MKVRIEYGIFSQAKHEVIEIDDPDIFRVEFEEERKHLSIRLDMDGQIEISTWGRLAVLPVASNNVKIVLAD